MAFIPHTDSDIEAMLESVGVDNVEALFDEIPGELRIQDLPGVPVAMSEMQISRLMRKRAERDGSPSCFIGAGAYEHHIPAAVWEITTRGEYYSAYTPYQAEASQGTLQLIYEYQSMMTSLTGMDVSNASLYDGASSVGESCLMAVRANRRSKSRRILLAGTLNPVYQRVGQVVAGQQNLVFEQVSWDTSSGYTPTEAFSKYDGEDITAVVIQHPNFFGTLEDVDAVTDWAHAQGALVIAVVNPVSLAILKPPGEWGETGADIVCGEGQPLGVPLCSGGPYFGFMTTKQSHVRQMPGRIVGRTLDLDGKTGFTLTLQAREQHIRRAKATSNICTNQGLMVTAATIYLSILGHAGLSRVAETSLSNTQALVDGLCNINGITKAFNRPHFHEVLLTLDRPVGEVLEALATHGILGGYDTSADYPELGNVLLVCATETKTRLDIQHYVDLMRDIFKTARVA